MRELRDGERLTVRTAKWLRVGDLVEDVADGSRGTITETLADDGMVRVRFGDLFPMGLWPRLLVFRRALRTTEQHSKKEGADA